MNDSVTHPNAAAPTGLLCDHQQMIAYTTSFLASVGVGINGTRFVPRTSGPMAEIHVSVIFLFHSPPGVDRTRGIIRLLPCCPLVNVTHIFPTILDSFVVRLLSFLVFTSNHPLVHAAHTCNFCTFHSFSPSHCRLSIDLPIIDRVLVVL